MPILPIDPKPKVSSVLGIDVSTRSVGYCLFTDGKPTKWGEVNFSGKNLFNRVVSVHNQISKDIDKFKADVIAIEPIVYINNRATVISMAYAMGAVLAAIGNDRVVEYNPLKWQRAIGNPPLTEQEKDRIKLANPGKSKTWYSAKQREFRKNRTIAWVESEYGIKLTSDNVADAFGVAAVGWKEHGTTGEESR